MEFAVIVACTLSGGIAKDGAIPWHISDDLKRFRDITCDVPDTRFINAVIMGRKTWESLPNRPLRGRVNIVISTTLKRDDAPGALVLRSLDEAHALVKTYPFVYKVFVIGGQSLYREALYNHRYTQLYITMIRKTDGSVIECDRFIPIRSLDVRYEVVSLGDDLVRGEYTVTFCELRQKD